MKVAEGMADGWKWPLFEFRPPGQERRCLRERIGQMCGSGVFLVFLIQPVSEEFGRPTSTLHRAFLLAVVIGYAVTYLVAVGWAWDGSHAFRIVMAGGLVLFPIALAVLHGPDALVLSTYAISASLMALPRNVGALLGFGFVVALLVGTRMSSGTVDWSSALILVVLTIGMFAFGALVSTIQQLKATQERMARLAVAEERSRLARDLHDVLGHSLTTITVKAGLARRVLESATDWERAAAEVRDVEELARQAMTDVRSTVSGYRTASLPAELVGARAALQAAGIAADLPHAVDNVAAGLQETFGYVLREGVTNVIRHSGAGRCEVRLGENWIEVRDNGRANADTVTRSRDHGGGHGLTGLAERVEAVHGQVDAGPLPEGGFLLRVTATIPSAADPNDQKTDTAPSGTVARPSMGLS